MGLTDCWLVKTDSTGNSEWNQTFGGVNNDYGRSVVQTSDEGYVLAGYTESFGAGKQDFYLVKTDLDGNMQWMRDWFKYGLAWTDSTANTITLYRGTNDVYWNYVHVRIWKIKKTS